MSATTTRLMTFAEFEKLPDEVCRRHELRRGELVEVPPPIHPHIWLQQRLMRLLDRRAEDRGVVGMEVSFRPLGEYEFYRVDVAYVSYERWNAANRTRNLRGSPELIIEILSPSNTTAEMNERKKIFLESGCLEFWVLDPINRQIDVSTPDGVTTTYRTGQSIPLPLLGGGSLPVDDIFNGLD
jgi:Uma2 family endonuclease